MADGYHTNRDVADLCSQAKNISSRLIEKDFAEHFQWLTEIVEETRNQLWGDADSPRSPRPDTETGSFLLPRTPSMKRRRQETDEARLAALNASLQNTSCTGTRSRRGASRVAAVKMALAQQKQNARMTCKMRRPRSSCVRAEQRLLDDARLGHLAAADDTTLTTADDDDAEDLPQRRCGRSRRTARTKRPSPAPRGPASPYISVVEKPPVKTMVRAYETIVVGPGSTASPIVAVRLDASPQKLDATAVAATIVASVQSSGTPPQNHRQKRTTASAAPSMASIQSPEAHLQNQRRTRTNAKDTLTVATVQSPKTPPQNQRQSRATAAVVSSLAPAQLPEEESKKQRQTRTKASAVPTVVPVQSSRTQPPNERQTSAEGAANGDNDSEEAEVHLILEKTPPQSGRETHGNATAAAVGAQAGEPPAILTPQRTPPEARMTGTACVSSSEDAAPTVLNERTVPMNRRETRTVTAAAAGQYEEKPAPANNRRETRTMAATDAGQDEDKAAPANNRRETRTMEVATAGQVNGEKAAPVNNRRETRTMTAAAASPDEEEKAAPVNNRHETRNMAVATESQVREEKADPVNNGRETRNMAVATASQVREEKAAPVNNRRETRTMTAAAASPDEEEKSAPVNNRRQTRTKTAGAESEGEEEKAAPVNNRRETRTIAAVADNQDERRNDIPASRRETRSKTAAMSDDGEEKAYVSEPEADVEASEARCPVRRVSSAPEADSMRRMTRNRAAADDEGHESTYEPTRTRAAAAGSCMTDTATKPARFKAAKATPRQHRPRAANIAMPVEGGSFIQRAPARPTVEEQEERRRQELQRKREREDEARRKRDELMRLRVEEERQKREERQQRALELRRQRAAELQENYLRKRQARDDRVDAATAATETKRREEALRKRRQLAERQREIDEKRRQDEEGRALRAKQLADEERCRQEQEREAERQRHRQREAERIARERAELVRLAERQAALRAQEVAAAKSASAMNSTFTLKEDARMAPPLTPVVPAPTSYEITPGRDELPPKPLTDPHNYNIDDLGSDQSTDDEMEPRKVIPAWASGSRLQAALIAQVYHAVNADKVFPREDLFPDVRLEKIFSIPRRVFFKRTSSAVWDTPPLAKRAK